MEESIHKYDQRYRVNCGIFEAFVCQEFSTFCYVLSRIWDLGVLSRDWISSLKFLRLLASTTTRLHTVTSRIWWLWVMMQFQLFPSSALNSSRFSSSSLHVFRAFFVCRKKSKVTSDHDLTELIASLAGLCYDIYDYLWGEPELTDGSNEFPTKSFPYFTRHIFFSKKKIQFWIQHFLFQHNNRRFSFPSPSHPARFSRRCCCRFLFLISVPESRLSFIHGLCVECVGAGEFSLLLFFLTIQNYTWT